MKKFLTTITVICIILLAVYFSACNSADKATGDTNTQEDSLKKVVDRGAYLVNNVFACLDCHGKRDWTKYSGPIVPGTQGMGGEMFDQKMVGIPGVIYARNITPDPETGIGTWTDNEILRAITQGISKNGDTLFPLMPYINYNHVAKEDLLSVIAYIRTLKPIKNKVPERHLMIPLSMAYPAQALQKSVDANVLPPETDKVAYGAYLVNAANCVSCHTPMVKGQFDFSKSFAGGFTFDAGAFKVNSANITADSATGIGAWNEDRFLAKFLPYREEKNYSFNPGTQQTIMPLTVYAGMNDEDLKAIYAFIHSVKPISNKVEKYPK